MGKIRTKMYSNGTTSIGAGPVSTDPPFDFAAAKKGTVVVRAQDFGNTDNVLTASVWWGVRKRGLISVGSNITWVADAGLTVTLNSANPVTTPVAGVIPIPQMKSPLMKVVMAVAGTTPGAKPEVYFEQET